MQINDLRTRNVNGTNNLTIVNKAVKNQRETKFDNNKQKNDEIKNFGFKLASNKPNVLNRALTYEVPPTNTISSNQRKLHKANSETTDKAYRIKTVSRNINSKENKLRDFDVLLKTESEFIYINLPQNVMSSVDNNKIELVDVNYKIHIETKNEIIGINTLIDSGKDKVSIDELMCDNDIKAVTKNTNNTQNVWSKKLTDKINSHNEIIDDLLKGAENIISVSESLEDCPSEDLFKLNDYANPNSTANELDNKKEKC